MQPDLSYLKSYAANHYTRWLGVTFTDLYVHVRI